MVASMAAPAARTTAVEDWIVCLGEERAVLDGAVSCPRSPGRMTSVEHCVDCHLLMGRHDERSTSSACVAGA